MSTSAVGRRLLGEVESCELLNVFNELRAQNGLRQTRLGIKALDDIWHRHGGRLEITGRALPLLYLIVDSAVELQHGTVAVIDMEGRFDVTRLHCDRRHVHMFRPAKGSLKITLDSVEQYFLHGGHESKARELVAIIVNGGQGGNIMAHWNGWLRVEADEVPRFGPGMSVEEALRERTARQDAVDEVQWVASSDWGEFRWSDY